MNKTKTVATIGPSSSSKEVLMQMIQNGLDVARLNFSHGSYEDHQKVVDTIREINKELGLNTSMLADLQGPKLRVGEMENGSVNIVTGNKIKISTIKQIGPIRLSTQITRSLHAMFRPVKRCCSTMANLPSVFYLPMVLIL